MPRQKQKTKKKGAKSTKMVQRRKPPPEVIVYRTRKKRRNAAPAAPAASPPKIRNAQATTEAEVPDQDQPESERPTIKERVEEMDGSHVAVGVGAGALGNMLGVLVVGKGWVGPKTAAGLLVGTGALTTAAGYLWEADHVMVAGAGLATAGTFSLANQYAIDAYESLELRAKKKRQEQEQKELQKRLAEARVIVEADRKQQAVRNAGPRLMVVDVRGDAHSDDNGDHGESDDNYREDLAA